MAKARKYTCPKCGQKFKSSYDSSKHYAKHRSHAPRNSIYSLKPYTSIGKWRKSTKRRGAAMPLKNEREPGKRRAPQRGAYRLKKTRAASYNFCPNCAFPLGGKDVEVRRWHQD